ncbi:MarR family winged helix-turn-helix transcriptional regulator [Streptomyces uncialis]|uniref:MarR family winged helix-turn-helix transcriptional regulator n=1 Tax=Streptomyces uncialis TaxID=1048205 RepID=UPI002254F2EF|nr:MarR family transcriptional regulator [Streptomyces uncialis]MCX4662617.1 MarR family transcriptional regulator [Streptomyces uncialis]
MARTNADAMSRPFKVGVWRTLMEVHNEVLREIERELADRHRLSVSEFDALVNIPLAGTRMKDLKHRIVLTASAVSRLCDRLSQRGLVTRTPVEEDQRGALIQLTDEGRKLLRAAVRTNAEVVERMFADRLTPDELRMLGGVLGRLRSGEGPEACDTEA